MRSRICGNKAKARRAAVYQWDRLDITWQFAGNLRGLKIADTVALMSRAVGEWASVCGIRPTMWVPDSVHAADIVIHTLRLDGPGDTLAQMELPELDNPRQIVMELDITERFVIDDSAEWPKVSLRHVFEHEFGHALGIDHGGEGRMEAFYNQTPMLDEWSIAEAVKRYGEPGTVADATSDLEDIVLYQTPDGYDVTVVRS